MLHGGWISRTPGLPGWGPFRIPATARWTHGTTAITTDGWRPSDRHIAEYADLPLTMGHYTRDDLPFYYALADAFTVCDQNYCSVMTSTTPNRSYFLDGNCTRPAARRFQGLHAQRRDRPGRNDLEDLPGATARRRDQLEVLSERADLLGWPEDEEEAWLSNFGCNLLEYFQRIQRRGVSRLVLERCRNRSLRFQKQIGKA